MRHDGPACCLQRRAPGGPRSSLLGAPLSAGQRARSVLRLREGDCLEVCDGRGNLVAAVLRGITHQKRAYAEAVEGVRQARARARLPARAASAMAVGCRDGRAVSGAAPCARHEAFIEDRCKSACLPACWLSFSIQCLDHGLCCARCCHVTRLAGGAQVAWQGPRWEVVAACGSLKGGRADWLVEKCTELGAWSLCPILTARSPSMGVP